MTKDQFIQDQMDEIEEQNQQAICRDAAIMVLDGDDRHSAIAKARDIHHAQEEAVGDPTGTLELSEEAQSPVMPEGKERQAKAIKNELFQQFYG